MKTKKKLYKPLLYACLILSFGWMANSCSNIDLDPQGIITPDAFFSSPENYEKALSGVYDRLNYEGYVMWMDGVTDNGQVTQSWNWGYNMARGIANTNSNFATAKWEKDYISVQRANTIINNIDTYAWPDGVKNADRNRVLGEAQTLRAFFYLDLACTFGRIPFYTENPATVEESKKIKQTDGPKVVFDFLLKDLASAIANLPETPSSKAKIGKAAARLLRARTASYAAGYLNDKSYFKITLSETAELMKTAPQQLGNYEDLFKSGGEDVNEVILAKTYTKDIKNTWGNWYNQSLGGYCVTTPIKDLVDAYEYIQPRDEKMPYANKDPRLYASVYVPGSVMRGYYFNSIPNNVVVKDGKAHFDPAKDYGSLQDKEVMQGDALNEGGGAEWNKTPTGLAWKKYCEEPETWTTYNAFIIFRYAEAYLLRAEALVETNGDVNEAKSLVKVIRDRAGNTNDIDQAVSKFYKGSLRDLIRNEMRVEFAQEGLRFFDIRRWKILTDVMNHPIEGIEYRDFSSGSPVHKVLQVSPRDPFNERDYWWPIPQEEIDIDSEQLTQNKGW